MSEWNAWRKQDSGAEIRLEGADLTESWLEGANLIKARLSGAELLGASLRDALLPGAWLEEAELQSAHLENANLQLTHLEGANLIGTYLEGTLFIGAIVDSRTIVLKCSIDEETDFTMVGLDVARVEPSLSTRLKANIRRIAWEKYCRGIQNTWHGKIKAAFTRMFWRISDHGSSTSKVLRRFFFITLIFSSLYAVLDLAYPELLVENNTELIRNAVSDGSEPFLYPHALINAALWFLQIWCFTVGTMMTLGFGGINVAISPATPWFVSFFGLIVMTLNLMLGYFLLAVFVTRIGIMFQSIGPEAEIPPPLPLERFKRVRARRAERSEGPNEP